MMKLNKYISTGLALAVSSLTLSTTVTPAQAAVLKGVINIAGAARFSLPDLTAPKSDKITFSSAKVVDTTTGSFTSLIGTDVAISPVKLTKSGASESIFGGALTITPYSATTANPFMTFANGLKFEIDQPIEVYRQFGNVLTLAVMPSFTGTFFGEGISSPVKGNFSVNSLNNDGSFSGSIEAVPEPLTLGATAIAGAVGVWMKRKKLG